MTKSHHILESECLLKADSWSRELRQAECICGEARISSHSNNWKSQNLTLCQGLSEEVATIYHLSLYLCEYTYIYTHAMHIYTFF